MLNHAPLDIHHIHFYSQLKGALASDQGQNLGLLDEISYLQLLRHIPHILSHLWA